jgi:hypothetical protein
MNQCFVKSFYNHHYYIVSVDVIILTFLGIETLYLVPIFIPTLISVLETATFGPYEFPILDVLYK